MVAVIVFGGQGVLIGDGNHFVNGAYHRKNTASLLPRCERLMLYRLGNTHRKTP